MKPALLSACLCTLLTAPLLPAQGFGVSPGGMPMLPAVGQVAPSASTNGSAAPSMPAMCPAPVPSDPTTQGPQLAGKQLAQAIRAVTALPWLDDLDEARVQAAATGKPILWLQALGELDGFA